MATIREALAIAIGHHQAGRLQAAEQTYRQILAVQPNQADAIHLLGVIAQQVGKYEVAVEYIGRAIRLHGSEASFHNNLGNAFRGQGKLDEAADSYRRALELKPDFAEAHNNLGTVLQGRGELDEAVACYRRALQLKADIAEVYANLGGALKDLGKFDEAIACCRRALDLNPAYAEAHNNLGNAFAFQGKLDEAADSYRRAVEVKPNYPEAHNNLGSTLQAQGRLDEALACCRRALELKPDYAGAHNNLGVVFQEQGKLDEAAACWRRTLELNPQHAGATKNLGDVLQYQGKLDEAAACYRRVVQLELGNVPSDGGDREESAACSQPAARPRSRHAEMHSSLGEAFLELATILRDRLPADDLHAMRQLSSELNLRDDDRAALEFGLAQALDARHEYDAAAEHMGRANAARLAALKKQGRDYSPVKHAHFIGDVMATFTPQFFARTSGFGLETELPVFIVGLPRSGTTLVEQILASHSRVFGGGELPYCDQAFQSLPKTMRRDNRPFQCLLELDREATRHLAQQYADRLRALDERATRIVDKMPGNHQYLGLIRVLFPQARLIHCRRDLRDVALSCWATKFTSLSWTSDQEHLLSYFENYARVMDHWRVALPAPPLDVDYEELVEDTEGVAHRIVDWCGLEWEPGCLRFNETRRTVRTASATQVRRPIYKSSVGRWRNYENSLGELFSRVHRLDKMRPG
jgi:tetratricopeptide (TPR) repeat protein